MIDPEKETSDYTKNDWQEIFEKWEQGEDPTHSEMRYLLALAIDQAPEDSEEES